MFQSQEIRGGELTTHRVVGETEQGYITRGDANPFTDQDGAEPPVTESQIVAVAWQPSGQVVTIPNFGTAILAGRVVVSDGGYSLNDSRTWKALTEEMDIRFGDVGPIYQVDSPSGKSYEVDVEAGTLRGQDTFDPRYAALFLTAFTMSPPYFWCSRPN